MIHLIARRPLYERVWSTPMMELAPSFGISDVALANTCASHGIPVPGRGHWRKVARGKRTFKPPLPERGPGISEFVCFGGHGQEYGKLIEPQVLLEMEIPPPPVFAESSAALIERVRKLVGLVGIAKDFSKPHRVITKLLADDDRRCEDRWAEPMFCSAFERRRLRILNAVLLALARSGVSVSLTGENPSEFRGRVGHQPVSFVLDDPGQVRSDGYRARSRLDKPATDKLVFEIKAPRPPGLQLAWRDGDTALEQHVRDMVVAVIVAGELGCRDAALSLHQRLTRWKAEAQERECQRQAEEARREKERKLDEERRERERAVAEEQARADRLLAEANDFRRAAAIRDYVAAARGANTGVASEQIDAWATRALALADGIDPVRSRRFLEPDG